MKAIEHPGFHLAPHRRNRRPEGLLQWEDRRDEVVAAIEHADRVMRDELETLQTPA